MQNLREAIEFDNDDSEEECSEISTRQNGFQKPYSREQLIALGVHALAIQVFPINLE